MGPEKKTIDNTEEIIDYLSRHPDIFIHHPELLTKLHIPHEATGDNISSLIEYQVVRFRQQAAKMQHIINFLEEQACSGRRLARQIYNLTMELLMVNDLNKLYSLLEKELKKYYHAHEVLLLIFRQAECKTKHSGMKFFDPNSKLEFMFTEIFHRKRPLCDSLQEEHIKALFEENGKLIQSTVLTPLYQPDWKALLVLGSQQQNRYNHGFELDLLVYLSRITAHSIASLLKDNPVSTKNIA